MKFIADLQIHSRFARACSKDISIENLEKWARIKGVDVLGTGDFIHPVWLKELKEELIEDGSGILRTKNGFRFVLQGEVSNIYSQGGKLRKVHNLIFAANFEVVDQIKELLGRKGNLKADGRPIFGSYSCIELVEDLMGIDKDIEVIPAHVMTPWFGVFGSKSGFDSIEECFGDQARHIHAIETGMSADPAMMWRVEKWNKFNLVSNSDSHSFWPWRIGRESTVFDLKSLTYDNVIKAIRTGEGLEETIEVDPAYGKYHWDGHRVCNVSMDPKESARHKNICPVCKKMMTIGVENRIEELATKPHGFKPENSRPFKSLIPLSEIISSAIGVNQPHSQKVWAYYNKLLKAYRSEFSVLLETPRQEIARESSDKIADAIIKVREGRVKIKPGYDGVYGQIVFEGEIKPDVPAGFKKQKSLADF